MSYRTITTMTPEIRCDGWGCTTVLLGPRLKFTQRRAIHMSRLDDAQRTVKRWAEENGWVRENDQHFCPDCA